MEQGLEHGRPAVQHQKRPYSLYLKLSSYKDDIALQSSDEFTDPALLVTAGFNRQN